MNEPSKSYLSRGQIKQALAMLREEQEVHPISSAQRKIFFWFGISLAVFFGAIFLFILLEFFVISFIETKEPWAEWLNTSFILLFCISFLSIIILLFWNMKLIWQTWREFRIALSTKLWQLTAKARTGKRWFRRAVIGIGALCVSFFLVGTLGELFVCIPLTAALLAFFFLRFVRRRLDVLRNTDQIIALLTKMEDSESHANIDKVAIPSDVFKEMGGIEDVHIQRRRTTAISSLHEVGYGYAILRSRAMIADISKLDEATQLRVETRISEIATEFPPVGGLRVSGGAWRIPVTETPYEIVCRQDEATRRIELLSLEQGSGKSPTAQTVEAPRG